MALQSALSHLRTSAGIQSSVPIERKPEYHAVSAEPTSVSAVSLFNLEDDAFNFSDSDFLNEDPSVSFSVTCNPASLGCCGDRLRSSAQGKNREARTQFSHNRTESVSGETSSMIPSKLGSITKPSVTAAHSVSRNCLEKLRSFTFVRTPNMKSGRRKPEAGSIVMPPAKRTVGVDVTTIRGSDPSSSQRGKEPCDMVSQQLPCPPGPAVLRQESELGNPSPSNVPPQPKQSSPPDISIPSQDKIDFDFDAFLSELEGTEDSTVVSTVTQSTKHPPTLKPPSYNPRDIAATTVPKRDGIQSYGHSTPSSLSSCSVHTPLHAATISNVSRTPLQKGPIPSNVEFRTPVMKNLGPNTVDLTSTPSTHAAASSSTVFTTPRTRKASRGTATPSNVTTPIFKTPSGSRLPMRRKFPGPAGLLPTLTPGQSMESITIPPPSTPVPASTPRAQRFPPPTPQDNTCPEPDEFSQGPWLEMLEDLDMTDASSSMLLQYNIASALKQASSKQLHGGKVVHLRVVLKSIVPAGKNASAVLKDPTGEVLCTIHTKVLDDHQKELQPGAVLILRQVSVFSPTPRKHYLNITPDNIVRIYSPNAHTGPRQPLLLSHIEKQCAESNTSHCPTTPMVTPWREDPSGIGKQDDTQSEGKDRFNSVLKSCQNTLATFARSSQLSQQSVTSHSNQTLSSKHVLPPVLIQNAGTPNVSLASGNQDDGKIQNSWNDNGGDSFEDWEEYFDAEMQPVQMQSSDVGGAAGNAPQEQKESAFFNNLPEDEFDSLFTDVANTSFGF